MTIRPRTWAALIAVVALTATTSTAVANHVFPDSTANQAFHEQVGNVAGAGCTTGFPDGTFRPQDNVNRQQFAAWMNRCGGRVGHTPVSSEMFEVTAPTDVYTLREVVLAAGATGDTGTGGFVIVTADVEAGVELAELGACPCDVGVQIRDVTAGTSDSFVNDTILPGAGELGEGRAALSVTSVFAIGPDETHTFRALGRAYDSDLTTVSFATRMTAVYVPFGPDGDNTIEFEPA